MNIRDKWTYLTFSANWDHSVIPIYEASAGGYSFPLLKTLLTNDCRNTCRYCAFRSNRNCVRESWNVEELANVTFQLWREGKVGGLFLSSSVFKDPDIVTDRQLSVLQALRRLGYNGYIHLRLMPGVSKHYIRQAVELADRVGINLEAPTREVFGELCPDKGSFDEAVVKRLEWIVEEVRRVESQRSKAKFGFSRSGVDTQMIVGAVEDNDLDYLRASEWLYRDLGLRRVYYSGFEPVEQTPLEGHNACSQHREYRLYQSSFLIRDYGFRAEDLVQIADDGGFLPNIDPKLAFAKKNADLFPVDLNSADYYELVKIPGIGPERARKIIDARGTIRLRRASDLEKVIGSDVTRVVSPYVILEDKKLTYFKE